MQCFRRLSLGCEESQMSGRGQKWHVTVCNWELLTEIYPTLDLAQRYVISPAQLLNFTSKLSPSTSVAWYAKIGCVIQYSTVRTSINVHEDGTIILTGR